MNNLNKRTKIGVGVALIAVVICIVVTSVYAKNALQADVLLTNEKKLELVNELGVMQVLFGQELESEKTVSHELDMVRKQVTNDSTVINDFNKIFDESES